LQFKYLLRLYPHRAILRHSACVSWQTDIFLNETRSYKVHTTSAIDDWNINKKHWLEWCWQMETEIFWKITCHSATLFTKSPSSDSGLPQVGLSDLTYEIGTIGMLVIFHLQTIMYMEYVIAFMIDLHIKLKSTSSNCLLRIYQNQTKIFKKK